MILDPILDREFLTRFVFAIAFYWCWGILAKGIFEPIQSYLGKKLFNAFSRKSREFNQRVAATRTEIDDLLLSDAFNLIATIDNLLNPDDLSDGDRRKFQEQLEKTYSIKVLTNKLYDSH